MTDETMQYELQIEGHLPDRWRDWFDGWQIRCEADGTTTLRGAPADQVALHGLLRKIRDLNLTLLALERLETGGDNATQE